MIDTGGWPRPPGGWPAWVFEAPYRAAAHSQQRGPGPIGDGANCQRYAYGILGLFGRDVANHRSSQLWEDARYEHPDLGCSADLDLVLFNSDVSAWGAHVAVVVGGRLLHLCAEVGRPAVWDWSDFARRDNYRVTVGLVRPCCAFIA